MTDEDRQKLCDALRNTHPSRMMCKDAANEIERLALVRSGAELLIRLFIAFDVLLLTIAISTFIVWLVR